MIVMKIRILIGWLAYLWKIQRLGEPDQEEVLRIKRLRDLFNALPSIGNVNEVCSEWQRNRVQLRRLVQSDDPRRFLSWKVIRRTMFVNDTPYLYCELDYLQNKADWDSNWSDLVIEDSVGSPARLSGYPVSSGTNIHHAYHLAKFEEMTQSAIKDKELIVEFGGGYGNMCRAVHRMGFRGQYVIIDLPEFSLLQQYFLESNQIEVYRDKSDFNKYRESGVYCVSDLEKLTAINGIASDSLFIACWSLSETPLSLRTAILQKLNRFRSYLIGYQSAFEGVNNTEYFDSFMRERPNNDWSHQDIIHLAGNYYIFGKED